jgi:DNA polymerase-1
MTIPSLTTLSITTNADAVALYETIPAGTLVGLDIETMRLPQFINDNMAGLDPHRSAIRLIQFYTPTLGALVIDLGECPSFAIRDDLRYVAYNALFEIKFIRHRYNNTFAAGIECGMLMEQLIYATRAVPHTPDPDDEVPEEEQGLAKYKIDGYSLAAAINRHYGIHVDKSMQMSDWGGVQLTEEQIRYAASDAVYAYHLGLRQIQIIKQEGMLEIYKLQRDMLHVVADMELTGIAVDWERHAELMKVWDTELAELNAKCVELFGTLEIKGKKQPVNVNSSIQLGMWLRLKKPELIATWPRTNPSKLYPQGNLQFGSKVLPDYAAEHPEFAVLLKQKKLQKMVSSFGQSLVGHKNPVTNRIHPSYKLGSTSTGRMSCNSPNLQQAPSDKQFRELFTVPLGNRMVGGDFAQIEVQVQGQMSGDPVMIENYRKGDDIYKTLACKLFNLPDVEKTSKERKLGKELVLSLAYSMQWRTFKLRAKLAGILISDEESMNYCKGYHDTFHVYSQWCNGIRTKAELTGEATTLMGKKRKISPDKVFTQAVNLVIQGTAAELLQLTMVLLRKALQPYQAIIIACIHDEILIECVAEDADCVKEVFEACARQAFEKMFSHKSKDILEANIGMTWAQVK